MAETETNKTEEATPFKLQKAREKGQVARGADLGFFSALVGLILFIVAAGPNMIAQLSRMMARTLSSIGENSADPAQLHIAVATSREAAIQPVVGFCAVIFIIVVVLEVIQLRGLVFSAQALKPDFSRLNPGKGFKRVFSMRTLKETLKSVIKLFFYTLAAALIVIGAIKTLAPTMSGAPGLVQGMYSEGLRMVIVFACLALVVAIIDQIISRNEFSKEMRMTRSDLTRESKEREGDPRQKQKRKQLHTEFASQTQALSGLGGSDVLIVNPEHIAIGLRYNSDTMVAPLITAKGRNQFAQILKRKAALLSIPILQSPALARALNKACQIGGDVPPEHYRSVADIYLKLHTARSAPQEPEHA
jgi:flagellar biosynthesis protein FlhB